MVMDLSTACGDTSELFWGSRDGDDLSGIKSRYTERRTGSSLAIDTMAGNDELGWLRK